MSVSDDSSGDTVSPSRNPRLAIGVDSVEIARVAASVTRYGERFLGRVFTAAERARTGAHPRALAGRFAAKEATAKALGTGIGPVGWRNIEVRNDAAGKPYVVLHAAAATRARSLGLLEWHLSITHNRDVATAFVVAYRAETPHKTPKEHYLCAL